MSKSSGSEDEGDKDASKLPARVLLAPAQLGRGLSDEDIAIEDVDSDNNEGEGDCEIGKRKRTGRSRTPLRSRNPTRQWKTTIESVPPQPIGIFPPPNYGEAVGKTANELFQLFWKDGLLDIICQESNEYAQRENRPNPNIKREELRTFIGILLLSGYTTVPDFTMYWECGKDTRNEIVSNSMSRDRFKTIKRNLHFNGVSDDNDRYWKLRPLMTFLQKHFMERFVPERNVSHDEAMVKYYGKSPTQSASNVTSSFVLVASHTIILND